MNKIGRHLLRHSMSFSRASQAKFQSPFYALAALTCAGSLAYISLDEQKKQALFPQPAECAAFRDKHLDAIMSKVEEGIRELIEKNPGMPEVKLASGLRGTRYYIEFPIMARNVDAMSLLTSTKQLMTQSKENWGVKITNTDSYLAEENIAYLLDYNVESTMAPGSKSRGSVYIRGVKGHEGWDSFKFVLEKANDFSDFDA